MKGEGREKEKQRQRRGMEGGEARQGEGRSEIFHPLIILQMFETAGVGPG